jgi:molybdopterin molybdotransferase
MAVRMPLKRKIASAIGRTDYVRVRIEENQVVPLAIRGASILTSTTRAHGFVIVPKDLEGYPEGEAVTVRLY